MEGRSGPSWIRDEREVALNDVFRLCLEIADHCEDAAARLGDAAEGSSLAGLFEQIARQRRAAAKRIERLLRAHGELPDEPDPDEEIAHRAVEWVKAMVASDEEQALLETRLSQEALLAGAIEHARGLDLPEDAAQRLDEVAREVSQGRERLEQALHRTTGRP